MNPLAAFFRLQGPERVMAVEAAFYLLLARLLVRCVPMRYWRGRLHGAAAGSASPDRQGVGRQGMGRQGLGRQGVDRQGVGRIVGRIVRAVARRLPVEVVCLPRAVAAHWMLRRRGISSHVVFGVRRAAPGRAPDYHAWLTVDGDTVMGGRNAAAYAPLLAPGCAPGWLSGGGRGEPARPQ